MSWIAVKKPVAKAARNFPDFTPLARRSVAPGPAQTNPQTFLCRASAFWRNVWKKELPESARIVMNPSSLPAAASASAPSLPAAGLTPPAAPGRRWQRNGQSVSKPCGAVTTAAGPRRTIVAQVAGKNCGGSWVSSRKRDGWKRHRVTVDSGVLEHD